MDIDARHRWDRWVARTRNWIAAHKAAASGTTAVVLTGVLLFAALHGDTSSPTASPRPSVPEQTPQPTDRPAGSWAALELPPYEPIAELVPNDADGSGISITGSFTFRSLTSIPALELAAGLRANPATELVVDAGSSADLATIRPTTPLVEGARYRFELLAPDGSLAAQWTFRTGGPLHVVRLLPDDRTTQVPLDTGIEFEFDQDNVVDVASHFSIEPSAPGTFERHGRTWAWVPDSPLEPATLYRVTLTAGVGVQDSVQVLEEGVLIQFETAASSMEPHEPIVFFDGPTHELLPDEVPVIPVNIYFSGNEVTTITKTVDLYHLATLEMALSAASTLSSVQSWATWSSTGSVSTAGLDKAATVEATVTGDFAAQYMRLQAGLAAGWYLLEVIQEGRHSQVVLQVTDLAAYTLSSESRTVAWVNDITRAAAVAAASVEVWNGTSLGQTDPDGLLDVATPDSVKDTMDARKPLLLLVSAPDGRQLIAPLTSEPSSWYKAAGTDWWLLFGTDRLQYRRDDSIHAWGLVRSRATRDVPDNVELRLFAGYDINGAPIARVTVAPTPRGVFVGDLPIRNLPLGQYQLAMLAGGDVVGRTSISVAEIRKPAFRIGVATDRRAYLNGDRIEGQATADFYDGSAAPGLSLRLIGWSGEGEIEQVVRAGPTGAADFTVEAVSRDGRLAWAYLSAMPAQPEEGSSEGQTTFVVFPATVWLDATASVVGGVLKVEGTLSRVDFAAAEDQLEAEGWVADPSGEAIGGGRVTIKIDEITWKAVQVGTTYDFLLKKAVPRYRYDQLTTPVGTFTATSGPDGDYALELPAGASGRSYAVTVSAADAQGRVVRANTWAAETNVVSSPTTFPYLEAPATCGPVAYRTATLDEDVTLTIREGDGSSSPAERTLFVIGRLGIDRVVVTNGSTIEQHFDDGDLPSLTVRAIRISPSGNLVTNDYGIRVLDSEKAIGVEITPDRPAYRPGGAATIAVRTVGPDGRPLAADVIVRAVDMKLFAVGGVQDIDVNELMRPVSAGFLAAYASHRVPHPSTMDGCGAATGGGGGDFREDFADLATFQLIATDSQGHGAATFELPDDLTSWGVSATAFASGLEAGTSTLEIPASLPFFVDSTIASEYLAGERPIVQLRAYGDGLQASDRVRFTVASPTLVLPSTTFEGRAFESVRVPLPALSLGDHRLTIIAERLGNGPSLEDRVARVIHVVPTRLGELRSAYQPVSDGMAVPGGSGLTTYVITDAGRGGLLNVLQSLAWNPTARLDTSLAADVARTVLIEEFGVEESSLPPSGFDLARAGYEGLTLLPYASPDLILTARAALVAPDRLVAEQLVPKLRQWADELSATRERRIIALAGLAGLGEEVLAELRELNVEGLTVGERLWLANGLVAAGDEDAARSIERAVLAADGRRLGEWVRLESGPDTAKDFDATALMLLLAAELRDPISQDLSRYLMDNPSTEQTAVLEQLGFVRSALGWLPRMSARFAWTVDGDRHEEKLDQGAEFTMILTADQRRTLKLEQLEGDLILASTWTGEAQYDSLPSDPLVSIERSVTPLDSAPSDQLVQVRLTVTLAEGAPSGCYQVTDLLPSGLAPVVAPWNGYDEWGRSFLAPYEVEGQRVSWCIGIGSTELPLGYSARVVSPGTYRWEPAVVQSVAAPSIGAATPVVTYTIR